jgi:next-to-BRCA1 protein 1
MFTVKATYRAETRKLSFRSLFFPTYDELCREVCCSVTLHCCHPYRSTPQLYRVFPISQNYYLSKLLFSPDSSSNARILIAKEVHSNDDYRACLATLPVRVYPSPLLKFTVFDENPHKAPSASTTPGEAYIPSITSTPIGARVSYPSHSDHRLSVAMSGVTSGTLTNANASFQNSSPAISFSHIPPPPVIFSSSFGVDADMNSPTVTNSTIGSDEHSFPHVHVPQSRESTARPPSCCAVSQAKAEIESLMASFKSDIDHIMNNTFGSPPPTATDTPTPVLPTPPCPLHPQPQCCASCFQWLGSSWYTCLACSYKLVCVGPIPIRFILTRCSVTRATAPTQWRIRGMQALCISY